MIRWSLFAIAICAFAASWGLGNDYLPIAAFAVLFANFATFCLVYDRPLARARERIAMQLRGMDPNSDAAQRLGTVVAKPTDADRNLGLSPMVLMNLITGAAAVLILIYVLWLRLM